MTAALHRSGVPEPRARAHRRDLSVGGLSLTTRPLLSPSPPALQPESLLELPRNLGRLVAKAAKAERKEVSRKAAYHASKGMRLAR